MRFFEIAGAPPEVVSTAEFDKELRFFMRGFPACLDKLRAFLAFRRQARPDQSFNSKDYPYKPGTVLAGWRHVHLIFGKVVVSYRIADGQIELCAVTDHDHPASTLAQYLNGLRPGDFHPFALPGATPAKAFSADDRREIVALFYEMATQDRSILKAAAQGALADLMEFVDLLFENGWTPAEKQQALLTAFGGQPGLAKEILNVMKTTGGG